MCACWANSMHRNPWAQMVSDQILLNLCALWEPTEGTTKPLHIIYHRSWRTGEVPEGCRMGNVSPVSRKGTKEHLGKSRPVSLAATLGKWYRNHSRCDSRKTEERVIRSHQHGFAKGKSHTRKPAASRDAVTSW